jgi:hypothetical protein
MKCIICDIPELSDEDFEKHAQVSHHMSAEEFKKLVNELSQEFAAQKRRPPLH